MMTIQIDGVADLLRRLNGLGTDLPRAVAAGLNRTIRAVEQNQLVAMERHLDRPTPFTLNATGIFQATASRLEATLFVKDIQAKYMRPTIFGGIVASGANPDNNIIPVIPNVRLNAYGNLAPKRRRGAMERIAGTRGKRFVGKVNGRVGVYERLPNRRLKTIVYLDPAAQRDKRLPWFETAERVIRNRGARDVQQAVDALLSGRGWR